MITIRELAKTFNPGSINAHTAIDGVDPGLQRERRREVDELDVVDHAREPLVEGVRRVVDREVYLHFHRVVARN